MNTVQSEAFIKEWTSRTNTLKRKSFMFGKRFNTTPEILFPLFCPTTELDWLPGWKCELLHSDSGVTEGNAIFRTEFFGPEEVWICTRFEPNREIHYSRTGKDYAVQFIITVVDHFDCTATATWAITLSALTEAGNLATESIAEGQKHLEKCIDDLAYYVDHGEIRK